MLYISSHQSQTSLLVCDWLINFMIVTDSCIYILAYTYIYSVFIFVYICVLLICVYTILYTCICIFIYTCVSLFRFKFLTWLYIFSSFLATLCKIQLSLASMLFKFLFYCILLFISVLFLLFDSKHFFLMLLILSVRSLFLFSYYSFCPLAQWVISFPSFILFMYFLSVSLFFT